jgi:hypothetical protein
MCELALVLRVEEVALWVLQPQALGLVLEEEGSILTIPMLKPMVLASRASLLDKRKDHKADI